jgi:hypothetical protein
MHSVCPKAEVGHQLAYFLRDKPHEVHNVRGIAGKPCAKLWVLGGNTHRAGVQMAGPHHDAAETYEWSSGEPKLFGTEQGGDYHIATSLQLSVGFECDSATQVVKQQCLVSFG